MGLLGSGTGPSKTRRIFLRILRRICPSDLPNEGTPPDKDKIASEHSNAAARAIAPQGAVAFHDDEVRHNNAQKNGRRLREDDVETSRDVRSRMAVFFFFELGLSGMKA